MLRNSLTFATCALGLVACAGVDTTQSSGDAAHRTADALINSDGILLERPGDVDGPDQGGIQFPLEPDRSEAKLYQELRDSNCKDWAETPFTSRTIEGNVTGLSRIQPWTAFITGDVILDADLALDHVRALRCVEGIGGTLRIEGHPDVSHIVMPQLREVGALEIRGMDGLKVVRMHKLEDVGQITIADAPVLDIVRLPQVTALPDGLALEGLSLESLESFLPGLEEAGSVSLIDLPQFDGFMHDPIALGGGAVELSGLDSLTQLVGFPFEEVGDLVISDNAVLAGTSGASVQDDALVEISQNPVLADLDVLAAAQALGATNIAGNPSLETLDGFAGVTAVDGDLVIADHSALIDITGLDGLVRVEGDLRITGASALSAEDLAALALSLAEVEVAGELEVSGVQ
jgi:hypothetical protein